MNQHDQARFGDFGGTPAEPWHDQPRRVSALAVSSLVTGIVSFVGCCVPALGVLPVLLGVIAIVVIQKARGALAGRGLAVGGVVLGLLSLVASTGIWIGITFGANQVGPVYSQAFSDDPTVVRSVLASSAASQITDEQIIEFQAQMAADVGAPVAIPKGLTPLWGAYQAQARANSAGFEEVSRSGRPNLWPLPAETPQGSVLVVIELAQGDTLGSGLPAVKDAGYITPDGRLVWLLGGIAPAQNESPAPTPTDETTDPSAPDPGG